MTTEKLATKIAFAPKGQTFKQRLDAWIIHVRETHGIVVKKGKAMRTKEWQQKHHVAHMFLYNGYNSKKGGNKPAVTAKGGRTIAWAHFSDAKIQWATVRWEDFLRTKTGAKPTKSGNAWKAGAEPEEAATIKHVKAMQVSGGIGEGGQAMVSSGLKPCGEPCKCRAGRSRHLSGEASDLNSADLNLVVQALSKAKGQKLDAYLKDFGLYRNLLKAKKPETWHVVALADSML